MNDDELDNIFGVGEDDDSGDTAPDTVSDEKETDGVSTEESAVDESSEEKEEISAEDFKPQDPVKKQREEKKLSRALEREKAMKAAEKYVEELREKRIAARAARREEKRRRQAELPPLKERTYLDDFPLTFRTTILVLLGLLVLASGIVVAFNPMFRIGNFIIEGNHALTEADLIEATGLDYNDHIFEVFAVNITDIKAHNPYIRDLDVSISFPGAVRIKLTERNKIAYIKCADGYFAVDSEGTVLEFSATTSDEVHPLLCGLDINRVVLGDKVDIANDVQFQKMIIILGAALQAEESNTDADYSFFESIQEIRIIPTGMIFMTVNLPNGSVLQVKFADIEDIGDSMHWIMFVITEGDFNDLPDGVLDMTDEEPLYRQYDF